MLRSSFPSKKGTSEETSGATRKSDNAPGICCKVTPGYCRVIIVISIRSLNDFIEVSIASAGGSEEREVVLVGSSFSLGDWSTVRLQTEDRLNARLESGLLELEM